MKQYEMIQPRHMIFALDIGTRSIIGILGEADGDQVRIIDTEVLEHTKRAMIDGQIEDIAQVARIAGQVKENLEKRNQLRLTRVSVAAAGRALHTHQVSKQFSIDQATAIDAAKIAELESKTLEYANLEMFGDQQAMVQAQFYCVGYSIKKYFLDGYPISNLLGHRGQQVQIDMLVTFLPNAVVESLYATMTSIELEIESLTLEPIAAMNLVIPPELRNLNLVLVDIGAGTSDIAISREGSVVAYAMATIAGDELTEAICEAYLVDFHEGERIKHALSSGETIAFMDILGMEYKLSHEEVFDHIRPALDQLCTDVTDKIIEANGVSPAAVFLVGGASKIPTIARIVSDKLKIDVRKVAVGGSLSIRKKVVSEHDVFHPEYVTPLGIALTALQAKSSDGLAVTVNGKRSHMMIKQTTSVIDILLSSGYQYQQMIASSGKNVIYTLDGQNKIIRGSYAKPAEILVNDKPVNVFTQVKGGDVISFVPSLPGKDAKATIAQVIQPASFSVRLNGRHCLVGKLVLVNGLQVLDDYEIKQEDSITTMNIETIEDLCRYLKVAYENQQFYVNQQEVSLQYRLAPNDEIDSELSYPSNSQRSDVQYSLKGQSQTPMTQVSSIPKVMPVSSSSNASPTSVLSPSMPQQAEMMVTINGKIYALELRPKENPYVFLDMLNYIDIDLKQVRGDVILRLNGKDASYLDPIVHGDDIVIAWG